MAIALVLLSLASTGCGALIAILGGLAVAAVTDAIKGTKHHHGDPTVLVVFNDAASTDTIVEVDVARVDGTEAPSSHLVGTAPGFAASFSDVFDPGAHWVRVVFASGWRSRARVVDVVAHTSVVVTFLHDGPDLAALAGSWFGAVDASGVGHTYALTLDASGNASGRAVDGVADLATGALEETSEGVYRLTWSDASVIALVADVLPTAAHAALVSPGGTVGVLEKGASAPLPTAVDGDVVGAWTGLQVHFSGATLTPVDVDAASATVDGTQHWDGRDGSGGTSSSTSPLVVSDAAYLRFFADAADGGLALDLALGLSPDRESAAVTLTPSAGGVFPDDVRFQLLAKSP